jgi:hypothetical protein
MPGRGHSNRGDLAMSGFNYDDETRPRAFIQWKGTDVCMDFHCECGAHCHFDGYFAYTVRCPHCAAVWEMPHTVFPRRADDQTYPYWRGNPKMLEPDENKDLP